MHGFKPRKNVFKLDEGNPDEIYVLNLLRFKPGGGRDDYEKYGKVTQGLMDTDEVGSQGAVIVGKGGDDSGLRITSQTEMFEDMYLVQYPSLGALLGMNSKPEWQEADKKYRSGENGEGGGPSKGGGVDLTWPFPSSPFDNDASGLQRQALEFHAAQGGRLERQ